MTGQTYKNLIIIKKNPKLQLPEKIIQFLAWEKECSNTINQWFEYFCSHRRNCFVAKKEEKYSLFVEDYGKERHS